MHIDKGIRTRNSLLGSSSQQDLVLTALHATRMPACTTHLPLLYHTDMASHERTRGTGQNLDSLYPLVTLPLMYSSITADDGTD